MTHRTTSSLELTVLSPFPSVSQGTVQAVPFLPGARHTGGHVTVKKGSQVLIDQDLTTNLQRQKGYAETP